jgi:hypothetical protein
MPASDRWVQRRRTASSDLEVIGAAKEKASREKHRSKRKNGEWGEDKAGQGTRVCVHTCLLCSGEWQTAKQSVVAAASATLAMSQQSATRNQVQVVG